MAGARLRRPPPNLDEFGFIEVIRARFGARTPDLLAGIGDDAAVVRASGRTPWVFTTDLLADGVHFSLATTSLEDLGFKAGAANLSDLAAMGARPRYVLVDLAVPSTLAPRELLRFYHGLSQICRPHAVGLIGGDTSASRNGLFIAITAIGRSAGSRPVFRHGAKPGHSLFVSGTIGDSLAGLELSRPPRRGTRGAGLASGDRARLLQRHRRPKPQVALGVALGERGLASAMIDVSDGLSGDLPHLCESSGVGACVQAGDLPLSTSLQAYARATDRSPVDLALQGGEDYELLFTTAPQHRPAVRALARRLRVRITEIGRIMPASYGRQLCRESGALEPLPMTGYRHFRSARRP